MNVKLSTNRKWIPLKLLVRFRVETDRSNYVVRFDIPDKCITLSN